MQPISKSGNRDYNYRNLNLYYFAINGATARQIITSGEISRIFPSNDEACIRKLTIFASGYYMTT